MEDWLWTNPAYPNSHCHLDHSLGTKTLHAPLMEGKKVGMETNDSSRSHYVTNPNNAQFFRKSLKITIDLHLFWFPTPRKKWLIYVNLMIPVKWPQIWKVQIWTCLPGSIQWRQFSLDLWMFQALLPWKFPKKPTSRAADITCINGFLGAQRSRVNLGNVAATLEYYTWWHAHTQCTL